MPPPSSPRADTTNSPRLTNPPAASPTPLTGTPNQRAMCGDQSTLRPALAGAKGVRATPRAASTVAHAPSDPSRAQLAPPSASTVTVGAMVRVPSGVSKTSASPVPAGPAPARPHLDAQLRQPRQPGAQQRRGLHRHWKHAARRAGEHLLPQPARPVLNRGGAERRQHRPQRLGRPRHSARRNAANGSSLVRFSPRFARPSGTCARPTASPRRPARDSPARASSSAAISPAGPAPTTSA